LNSELKPNSVYLLNNGHAYTTDAFGRVSKAEGLLDVAKADRNTWQQAATGRAGGDGYDGGHLIAGLFGGAGERINLVPQLATVNRGEFRVMEGEWARAVLAGRTVKVEVRPVYSGNSTTPDRIVVDHWIDGVRQAPRPFENKRGG
jgi:filamentous hemagglutinin